MKKYQGESGYRILRDAKIEQFACGDWQITHGGLMVISGADYDKIHLHDMGGHVATLDLGKYGQRLAMRLTAETEARYNV